jgi:hypothetical protein
MEVLTSCIAMTERENSAGGEIQPSRWSFFRKKLIPSFGIGVVPRTSSVPKPEYPLVRCFISFESWKKPRALEMLK